MEKFIKIIKIKNNIKNRMKYFRISNQHFEANGKAIEIPPIIIDMYRSR